MKRNNTLFLPTLLFALFFSGMISVLANGVHGQWFEKTIDQYYIGVGTDVYTLEAKDPIRFDFNLLQADGRDPVDFVGIWVRINQKPDGKEAAFDQTIFASGLRNPSFGYPGMTFSFPEKGAYELSVRFEDSKDETIVEATFPITVESSDTNQFSPVILASAVSGALLIGLVLGFAGRLLFRKRF